MLRRKYTNGLPREQDARDAHGIRTNIALRMGLGPCAKRQFTSVVL